MTNNKKLSIFQAQTINVNELERAWRQINRQINALILQKNNKGVEINTKLLTLIYCAFAEAVFSKLIHTPHGLEDTQIEQIKLASNNNGVRAGWLKCIELALHSVEGAKSNHVHNVKQKLTYLVNQYVFDPSIIRNKLAHGQWCKALNRENSDVNDEISEEIESHTVIELYRRKHALEQLARILEDIIESPNKSHHRDYWNHLVELDKQQSEMATWTFEEKVRSLMEKKSFYKIINNED